MDSLRARLILGSALIALVPLAAAMLLLTHRLEEMVRAQAASRLDAALGGLRVELASDAERVAGQLRMLARDPQLRRLYLVRPESSRDLADYLAGRRTLLALDFLSAADTTGRVVAGATGGAGAAVVRVEASAPILYLGARAGQVVGGLSLDDALLARLARNSGIELILLDSGGRPVATTLAAAESAATPRAAVPAARADRGVRRVTLAGRSYLARDLALPAGATPGSRITGLVSTASADRTIAAVQWTSAMLGLLGLALAIGLGVLWSSQVSRPVERLAAFSRRVAQGEWDEPLSLESVRELETLVEALDHMRGELRAYRDRLVISERQAAWSQMARKVAHEVRNPLTPIAVSVADLKRSYDQRRPDFPQILEQAVRTIGDQVESLKRMLQEFADFARMAPPRLAPCAPAELFADLAALYGREVAAGRLALAAPPSGVRLAADAGQIRQALVNLVRNGLESVDGAGRVTVTAAVDGAHLVIAVADDGRGLTEDQRARLFTPGFTTKPQGSGLGLIIVQRIVHDHQGSIAVDGGPGHGTTFRIRLPLAHGD